MTLNIYEKIEQVFDFVCIHKLEGARGENPQCVACLVACIL